MSTITTIGENDSGAVSRAAINQNFANLNTDKAELASPAFTGNPTAPTQSGGNNSTRIATTAFVQGEIATKANLASPTFTGVPAAPTAAGGTSTTQIATTAFVQQEKIGYALNFSKGTETPADATTYYFGSAYNTTGITTAGAAKIYIPKAGTLKSVYMLQRNSGTLGSNETSSIWVRINDTTDYLFSSSIRTDQTVETFSKTDFAIAVVAGDYIEFKWTTPTWATNPTSTRFSGTIYIE